ncbi:MAG: ABC transporter transmembrane domain-containing protein, partial [Huintestinicola sp.]
MNKKINPLKELLLYCRRYAVLLAVALILGAACAIFSVIGPNKIADMVDLIEQGLRGGFDLRAIGRIGIFLAVLYGLGWVFGYVQQFILTTVTQRMTQSLRTDISEKINRMPLKYFDSTS